MIISYAFIDSILLLVVAIVAAFYAGFAQNCKSYSRTLYLFLWVMLLFCIILVALLYAATLTL